MNGSITERKNDSMKLEERVKYFMNNQPSKLSLKNKKILRPIDENFNTVLDPYAQVGNINNASLNNNINTNININSNNKITNDSSLSTQSQLNNLENKSSNTKNNFQIKNNNYNNNYNNNNFNNNYNNQLTKSNYFIVNKDLGKYGEPKLKIKEFLKLAPKFSQNLNSPGESTDFKGDHNITISELEILETDEKLPQKKIEQYTKYFENNNKLKINNVSNDVNNPKLFNFLFEQEKCYQELSQDFKINGIFNIDYKLKIAGSYLNILINDENPLSDIIYNNVDFPNINAFFIREICFYLCILFLDDFCKKMNEDDIKDISACENYCQINLLYVINYFIEKKEINTEDYKKCETLIEINENKLNFSKYKENFHTNNKIIKNILNKLLLNLVEMDKEIINNILTIFNQAKKNKLKNIILSFIKNNKLITDKINKIIKESQIQNKNTHNEWIIEKEKNNQNILQTPNVPFLPPKQKNDIREYCLVLDLDETLVHYFEDEAEAYVKVRMGAENFITVLSKYCEIVIFTASTQYYADIVINGLDCKDLIDYKLYREHTSDYNGINIKDLSKLGRDMSKIIIIDNIEDNFLLQKENGLNINDFEGDENDNELQFLLDDLLEVVTQKGLDVREKLPKIRLKMQQRYANIA